MDPAPPNFMEALRAYLEEYTQTPTFTQQPYERPKEFIFLDRIGGPGTVASDSPTITIEAWATSKVRAYDLIQAIRAHINRRMPPLIGGIRVNRRSEATGPTYEPPTASGVFRYRWTVTITHQLVKETP